MKVLRNRLRIALINNMPDAALEDTEVQFFELLESAAGDIPVSLKLYSLPELPRGEAGQQHLSNFYLGIEDLLNSRFDGVIMTGTEPRQPDLRNEPYWPALGRSSRLGRTQHGLDGAVLPGGTRRRPAQRRHSAPPAQRQAVRRV